jgi:hypothetical protein
MIPLFGAMNFPNRVTHRQRNTIRFSSFPASRNIPANRSENDNFPPPIPDFALGTEFIST